MPATLHLDWDLPDGALDDNFGEELIRVVKEETAMRLFAEHKISSGYGARMLGITRQQFVDLLNRHHVPLFTYGETEIERECETVRQWRERHVDPVRDA